MGEVNKFLILVPASLGFQWTNEMVKKFNFKDILYNRKGRGWEYFEQQIASIDKAKREEHAKFLKKIEFDMVIVDEAHKLKNKNTLNWKFVNNLNKKYCLLLTATPIQNNLKELYNLISILYPDLYKSFKQFKKKYKADKHLVKKTKKLHNDLEKVMIRNSHKNTILKFSKRNIKQEFIELKPEEKNLYNKITQFVKKEYRKRKNNKKSVLNLLTYQRELCSSFYALRKTLARKEKPCRELKEIYQLMQNLNYSSKLEKLGNILKEIDDQVIIFTEYRATQNYIARYLEKQGYDTILFNGGYSSTGKEYIKYLFQQNKDVMISTEAGSQGLNLQFCNIIINYDLPWNPMKLEQRIGRVHRLGQTKDVMVYNLATKNTIEEKILKVLYKKIYLLKNVIGDMENVLIDINKGKSLEAEIIKIVGESETEKEIEREFDQLIDEKLNDCVPV